EKRERRDLNEATDSSAERGECWPSRATASCWCGRWSARLPRASGRGAGRGSGRPFSMSFRETGKTRFKRSDGQQRGERGALAVVGYGELLVRTMVGSPPSSLRSRSWPRLWPAV